MSDFAFSDYPISGASLILSDGQRTIDLVGSPPAGIYLVEFSPPIVADENTFASSPDMEGGIRTRTKPENPTGSGRIRVDESSGSAVSFWSEVDDLQDLFRSAHRSKGTIAYTPPGGTEVTFDLEAIRLTEMAHDHHLSKRRMEIAFEFVCKPYARETSATIVVPVSKSGPINSISMADVGGHVDAFGTLTVTADSTVVDDFEWGIDEETSAVIDTIAGTTSADFVISGYAGTLSGDQIEGTVPPSWTAVCATPELTHVGRYRVKLRCQVPETDTQVRFVWHSGEAPYTTNPVAIPVAADEQVELDLGVVNIVEQEGTHAWSGRFEVRGDTLGAFSIQRAMYIPATRYGRARGSRIVGASGGGLVAADNFNAQTAGTVTGKTAQLGGDWSGAGDTDDFTVDTTNDWIQRTAVSDADLNAGRYLRLGTGVATQTEAHLDVRLDSASSADIERRGIFLRYVDTSNWLMAVYDAASPFSASLTIWRVRVLKRLAGTVTELESVANAGGWSPATPWWTLGLSVDDAGNVALLAGLPGESLSWVGGVSADADLATGGVLDEGGFGIYDARTSAAALTRAYDNFIVTAPTGVAEPDHVINPSQSMQLDHRSSQRENAAGTRWGDVPVYTGRRMFVPPATRNDNESRLVFKWDSNDLATEAVGGGGTLTLALTAESRVLLTS